jgi:hypothetical protein
MFCASSIICFFQNLFAYVKGDILLSRISSTIISYVIIKILMFILSIMKAIFYTH